MRRPFVKTQSEFSKAKAWPFLTRLVRTEMANSLTRLSQATPHPVPLVPSKVSPSPSTIPEDVKDQFRNYCTHSKENFLVFDDESKELLANEFNMKDVAKTIAIPQLLNNCYSALAEVEKTPVVAVI